VVVRERLAKAGSRRSPLPGVGHTLATRSLAASRRDGADGGRAAAVQADLGRGLAFRRAWPRIRAVCGVARGRWLLKPVALGSDRSCESLSAFRTVSVEQGLKFAWFCPCSKFVLLEKQSQARAAPCGDATR